MSGEMKLERRANNNPWCSQYELCHGHSEAAQREMLVPCMTLIHRGMSFAKSVRVDLLFKLACVGALSFVSFGCTTMNLPEYKAEQIEQYSNLQTKNELSIAIRPIIDKAESEKYFGVSLLDANILALFIIAENRSTSSSFVISKEDFALGEHGVFSDELARDQRVGAEGSGKAVAVTGALLISPLLMFVGAKMVSDATVIKQNMTTKELTRRTISPGGRVEGFVYFDLPQGSIASATSLSLSVDVMKLQDRSLTHFEFDVRIKK